jgi:hypothetical protein
MKLITLLPYPLLDIWHDHALIVNLCAAILTAIATWQLTVTHQTPPVCQSTINPPPWQQTLNEPPSMRVTHSPPVCPSMIWLKKHAVAELHLQEWSHQTRQVHLKLQGEYHPMIKWLNSISKNTPAIATLEIHRASQTLGGIILEMSLSCTA